MECSLENKVRVGKHKNKNMKRISNALRKLNPKNLFWNVKVTSSFQDCKNAVGVDVQSEKYSLHKAYLWELNNTYSFNQYRYFRSSAYLMEEVIVTAPVFPESITEGDIKWLKSVGDNVVSDEVICEIETDKTSIPVPSPANGVITEIYAKEGDAVKYNQQLFKIQVGAGSAKPKPARAEPPKTKVPTPPMKPPQEKPPVSIPQEKPPIAKVPSSPVKREKLIVQSMEPKRELPPMHTKGDLPLPLASAFVRIPPQDPTKEISGTRSEYRVKMNRMRLKIADRLKGAQNVAAMLTTFNEIDMSNIIAFRKSNQEVFTKKYGIKLGFMSAFIKASAYALTDQPVVNAVIDGKEIVYRDYIDISVAVATPKGLVVPVLRNVQNMSYADIEKAIVQLGDKAKKGQLAIEDMDGGTFTISNGGVFGSLMGTPIINPPQSAILGMHATVERPVAIKQEVVIRPMMYVALTYDHRLIDGREAVIFLRKIKSAVENPTVMVAGI